MHDVGDEQDAASVPGPLPPGGGVFLRDRSTGEMVEARVLSDLPPELVDATERDWKAVRAAALVAVAPTQWPEDAHWDWSSKARWVARAAERRRMFGLECTGRMPHRLQGLLIVTTAGYVARLPEHAGLPLVYIDYLSTAPWNRRDLVSEPRFSGVGSVLLEHAILLSRQHGFDGRIALHSLPQAETFYQEDVGMSDIGRDAQVENLRYFEMTAEQARRYLGEELQP